VRATLDLPYSLAGAKGSLKRALLTRQMQKDLAMASAHPRNLFAVVNVSPGSIVLDVVIAEGGVRCASPMDVLHSLQQDAQANPQSSLRRGKLTRHIAAIEQILPYALDEELERELAALGREPSESEPSDALLQAASAFQAAGARKATNRGGSRWVNLRNIVIPVPSASKVELSTGVADLGDVAGKSVGLQNERPAPDRIWRPRQGKSKWSKVRDSLQKDSKPQRVVESQDQYFVPEPTPTINGVSIEIGELNFATKRDIERTLSSGKAPLGHLASFKEENGTRQPPR